MALKARDLMKTDIISVHQNTPIYDAMKLLSSKKISGLPVVDDENNLIGIITEKDMLRLLFSDSIKAADVVSNYMTKEVTTFSPDEAALIIGNFLLLNSYRRVPIVEDGKIVGIIARREIISLILEMMAEKEKLESQVVS